LPEAQGGCGEKKGDFQRKGIHGAVLDRNTENGIRGGVRYWM